MLTRPRPTVEDFPWTSFPAVTGGVASATAAGALFLAVLTTCGCTASPAPPGAGPAGRRGDRAASELEALVTSGAFVPQAAPQRGTGEAVSGAAAAAGEARPEPAAPRAPGPPESVSGVKPDRKLVEERWGIQLLGIHVTGAGHMLDLRYRVLDPGKAAPFFDRQEKPRLVDEETGVTALVPVQPKLGPLRAADKPVAGRNYFTLFGNPGGRFRRGTRATLVVGEVEIQGLEIQ